MNEYFPHLFEPIKIGKTTVKNRNLYAANLYKHGR